MCLPSTSKDPEGVMAVMYPESTGLESPAMAAVAGRRRRGQRSRGERVSMTEPWYAEIAVAA